MFTSQLDLSDNNLCGLNWEGKGTYTAEGITALSEALKVTASLTVTDLRYNNLDTESATMLANIAKKKRISLCGITPGQTEADFTPSKNDNYYMGPADAILLTADLAVIPSLTFLSLADNNLGEEEKTLLTEAAMGNQGLVMLMDLGD